MTWNEFAHELLLWFGAIFAPILTAIIIRAVNALAKKWGMDAIALDKENTEAELRTALNFGITQLLPQIEKNGWKSPQVQDLILRAATAYMHEKFPGRVSKLGGSKDNSAPVLNALSARLPDAVTSAAASPATPRSDPAATVVVNTDNKP